jgi:transposase
VRVILKLLVDTFTALEAQITALGAEINQRSKSDPTARRLMTIPGVEPITSTAITALVPAADGFPAGRDFAAWLGLTPLQKSTGGKQELSAVSKRRERTIRRLIIRASAVVQQASGRGWLQRASRDVGLGSWAEGPIAL